ncbi:MAG: hypothetical protein FWE82_03240 [Defluviitaleaceae bacterium]|nr:hypothetical protein [Defluviitaleaceae bacterium]
MFDAKVLNQLKQVDVRERFGGGASKVMERVKKLWSGADKTSRIKIMNLADIKKYTVERSYKKGNISAKLAAAMSIVLNVCPYYIIGASDENEGYSDEALIRFLSECGYEKLMNGLKKKRRTRKKVEGTGSEPNEKFIEAEAADDIDSEAEELIIKDPVTAIIVLAEHLSDMLSEEEQAQFIDMAENDVIFLLRSLTLRARYNADMRNILNLIKFMLVQ